MAFFTKEKKYHAKSGAINPPPGTYSLVVSGEEVSEPHNNNTALGGDASFYRRTFTYLRIADASSKVKISEYGQQKVMSQEVLHTLKQLETTLPLTRRKELIMKQVAELINAYLAPAYIAYQTQHRNCISEGMHEALQERLRKAVDNVVKNNDLSGFAFNTLPKYLQNEMRPASYAKMLEDLKKAIDQKPSAPKYDETKQYTSSEKLFGKKYNEKRHGNAIDNLEQYTLAFLRAYVAKKPEHAQNLKNYQFNVSKGTAQGPRPAISISADDIHQHIAPEHNTVIYFKAGAFRALRERLRDAAEEWSLATNADEKHMVVEKLIHKWGNLRNMTYTQHNTNQPRNLVAEAAHETRLPTTQSEDNLGRYVKHPQEKTASWGTLFRRKTKAREVAQHNSSNQAIAALHEHAGKTSPTDATATQKEKRATASLSEDMRDLLQQISDLEIGGGTAPDARSRSSSSSSRMVM